MTTNPRLPDPPACDLTPPLPPPLQQDRSSIASVLFGPSPIAVAFRYVEPTWRNYIQFVDAEARGGNADARRYLEAWQRLSPAERRSHVPEQLCEIASVPTGKLISWVSERAWEIGGAESSMVLSFMKPKALARTAEFAMESPDNSKHMELFLKASGALPASRGGGVINNFAPVSNASAISASTAAAVASAPNRSGLPQMDDEIIELSKVMQGDVLDAAPPSGPEYMEDEEEDEDDDGDESDD